MVNTRIEVSVGVVCWGWYDKFMPDDTLAKLSSAKLYLFSGAARAKVKAGTAMKRDRPRELSSAWCKAWQHQLIRLCEGPKCNHMRTVQTAHSQIIISCSYWIAVFVGSIFDSQLDLWVNSDASTVCKAAKTGRGEVVLISTLGFSLLFHTITFERTNRCF